MKLKEVISQFINWKLPQTSKSCKYNAYNCRWQLVNFAIFLRDKDIEKVREADITEYLNWSEYYGHSASTREKQAIAIKKMLEYCQMKGMKVEKPELVPHIKKDRPLPRVANESDYYKLINTIPKFGYNHIRNRAMISMLYDTGARLGEIISLNISDLDFENKKCIIKTEKSSNFRNIFFRNETVIYLKHWLQKREEILQHLILEDKEALFISVAGGTCGEQTNARRLDVSGAGEMLRKYSKMAGLKSNFNAHSLRHRYGRVLAEKGMDEVIIPQLMGHANIESSKVYVQLFGQKLKKIYTEVFGE